MMAALAPTNSPTANLPLAEAKDALPAAVVASLCCSGSIEKDRWGCRERGKRKLDRRAGAVKLVPEQKGV